MATSMYGQWGVQQPRPAMFPNQQQMPGGSTSMPFGYGGNTPQMGNTGGYGGSWGSSGAQLNSYTPSPYLNDQINQIGQQYTQDFTRNVLPTLRSNSVAMGNVGGSRAGIAEGLAAQDLQKNWGNAVTNLLGQDYTNSMNRNLQQYGIDSQNSIANGQLGLGYLNANNNYTLGQGNLALGNRTADQNYSLGMTNAANNRYATDTNANTQLGVANLNAQTQRYLGDQSNALGYAGLGNQKDIASMNNATTRYGVDANTGLGYAGLTNQANIAGMQNQTAQRGQDLSLQGQMAGYDTQRYLGDQNNQTQRYGIDQSTGLGYLNANNNYNLGQQANTNQATQIANNYALGQGNLNLGYTQANNNYNLGLGQNQNQAQSIANQYNLGLGQNANTRYGIDQTSAYQNRALDTNSALTQQQLRDNFYNTQRGQDITQQGQGLNFYGSLLNQAMASSAGTPTNTGFNWQGALGGALGGLQLGNNLGWFGGGSSAYPYANPYDGSYGFGTGSGYGFQDYGQYF